MKPKKAFLAALFLILFFPLFLFAKESPKGTVKEKIYARVLSVAPGFSSVTINRGRADNIAKGSPCVIRPNRGSENFRQIEWQISFAKGTIANLFSDSALVVFENPVPNLDGIIIEGDFCELEAEIPASISGTSLGKLAEYDIVFLEYQSGKPFFELKDLIRKPTRERGDTIIAALLGEARKEAGTIDGWYAGNEVLVGPFKGMTYGEAFRSTTKEHIEAFLDYVRYYPGVYIGYDWSFISVYSTWILNGCASADPERKRLDALPSAIEGDEFLKSGDYRKALAAYDKALGIYPDYPYARETAERVKRIQKLLRLVEADENDVSARFDLGLDFYNLQKYEDSLFHFLKAKELGYDPVTIDEWIGYSYASLGRYTEARKIFERLEQVVPHERGRLTQLEKSAYDNIVKWLNFVSAQELSQREGASVDIHVRIGTIKYEEQDYDNAVYEFNEALALEPASSQYRIMKLILGTISRRRANQYQLVARSAWDDGAREDAKTYWENALAIAVEIGDTPARREILAEMAGRMFDAGLHEEAIETNARILEFDPGFYSGYINTSRSLYYLGEYDAALDWAKRGIAVDSRDPWGYEMLGFLYTYLGKYDEAIPHLEKAADIDPTYKYPQYDLAKAYSFKKNYEEARFHFRKALEIDDGYEEARNGLKEVEYIIEALRRLKVDPKDAGARVSIAVSLYNLEDYGAAVEALLSAISTGKKDVTALSYLGYSYTKLGDFTKAAAYLSEANALFPKPNYRSWLNYIEAQSRFQKDADDPEGYLLLGEDSLYWGNYATAIGHFRMSESLGADPGRVAEMSARAEKGQQAADLYGLSTSSYDKLEFEKALEYAKQARTLYRSIASKDNEFWCLIRMGNLHTAMFREEESLAVYEEAALIASELGHEEKIARSLQELGYHYWRTAEYERAIKYCTNAREYYSKVHMLSDEAAMYASIGSLLGNLGERGAGLERYGRALEMYRTLLNHQGVADVLSKLGWAAIDDGDFSQALERMIGSLQTAVKHNLRWTEMAAYKGIGGVYFDLGDTDNSTKYYTYYLELATALGSREERSIAYNSLGLVHLLHTKDYDKALSLFKSAHDLAKLNNDILMEGITLSNFGSTYSRQGRFEEALQHLEQGLAIVRPTRNRHVEMQVLNEIGELFQKTGDFDRALDCHTKAIVIAAELGQKNMLWVYELNAGIDLESKGDFAGALAQYKEAASIVAGVKNRIKSEKLRKGYAEQEKQIEAYKRLIDLLIKLGKTEEALMYIEESKSKLIRDAFGDVKPETSDKGLKETLTAVDKLEAKKGAIEKEIQQEKKKPAEEQDKRKLQVLSSTLATTEGEFNQWMLKLKFQNRKMYDALTIKPTTLVDIQGDIPDKTLILEYFLSSEHLYIFCIARNSFFAKSVDIDETLLQKMIFDYLKLLRDPSPSAKRRLDMQAARLYEILLRPVEEKTDQFENIVLVPFGVLHYLPFHALIREDRNGSEYVIQRKRLCYTTSATFSDLLKSERGGMTSLLGFANPDGSLPGASDEVRLVKDTVFRNSAKIWTLGEATKNNFFKNAKDYDIVHLATHGFINKNPLESYLLFAGKNHEERELTLLEVAGFTSLRDKTKLVFLSACQTAMEEEGGSGSEFISLAEAFAMAGPPTLVATLWEVVDESTSTLVLTFYRELMSGKRDKLESLRIAQLGLLGSEKYSHPFFWAPFILIGSWR